LLQNFSYLPYALDYEDFFSLTIGNLEGIVSHENLSSFSERVSSENSIISTLLQAAGAVLWEFAKAAPDDSSIVSQSLQQVGLPADLANQFSAVRYIILVYYLLNSCYSVIIIIGESWLH
jgi:hypothetical protein